MAADSALHRLAILLRLLLLCSLFCIALPVTAARPKIDLRNPSIYVTPGTARPGATLHVTGHDLLPGDELALDLLRHDLPTPLALVTVAGDGTFSQDVVLPADTAGGDWLIRAMDDAQETILYADLIVAPPIILTLSPTTGPPGTVVTVDAGNLLPGTVQIDYAGVPLVGPVAVTGESFCDRMTIPGDRPDPLGTTVPVTLTHRLNGEVVGTASATFHSQPAAATPNYTFTQVTLPTTPLLPGETFTIEGFLDPAPQGDPSAYDVIALWQSDGKVLPISTGQASVDASGAFHVSAQMPDLLNGDPVSPADAGQVGLVLQMPSVTLRPASIIGALQIMPEALIAVRVLAEDTLLPLEGAMVRILPAEDLHVGDDAQAVSDSQLRQWAGEHGFSSYVESDALRFCDGSLGGTVDDSGYLQMVLNPWAPIVNPAFYSEVLNTARYGYGEHATVAQPPKVVASLNATPLAEDTLAYVVVVDAIEQGYAEINENGWPLITTRLLLYSPQSAEFHDASGDVTMPLEIVLPRITDPEKVPPMAIWLRVGWGTIDHRGYPLQGPLVSLQEASQNPDISLGAFEPVIASFRLRPHEHDRVLSAQLRVDGFDWGPFTAISSTTCSGIQMQTTFEYTCEVPPTVLSVGDHTFEAHVQTKGGHTIDVSHVATFDAPPAWFLQPIYRNRHVESSCEYYYWDEAYRCECRFSGETLPGGVFTSQLLAEDIPGKGDIRMGNQDNRAGADSSLAESVVAEGFNQRRYSGGVRSMALNTDGVYQITNTPAAGSAVHFSDGPITIVNTGRIPVYRDMWGLWPIASAQFGCDIWFNASLRYDGSVMITPSGSSTTLTVTPSASVGFDIWVDVSAIAGLVKAEVHALPTIGMAMPVTFVDGTMIDTTNCFRARLDVSYYSRVGCCKCGVCKKKSGTKNAFDYAYPDGCNVQLAAAPRDEPVAPEHANPALAGDGAGQIMSLWRSQDGRILSSLYQPSNADWGTPETVASGLAVENPALAFYRPQRAVALWTDTSLGAAAFAGATISEAIRSQHVRYALWDGESETWGAPQNLTEASSGEGQITVARDPQSETLTAVWMRDIGGDITQRQFRLFAATFADGAWSSIHAVDPSSTACDSQPSIAYQERVPLVAWIRDADRDLGTLADRRVALCALDGSSEVVQPNEIPAGVAEIDLAVTSYGEPRLIFSLASEVGLIDNRHTLHSASAEAYDSAWSVHALNDSHGRAIRGQHPQLTLDSSDAGTVTFRGTGFGPLPSGEYAVFQEPIGMERSLGELTQVETQFAGQGRDPSYLTADGAVYWQPAALYDPLTRATFAVAVRGVTAEAPAGPARLLAEDEPVVFAAASRLPDLVIEGLHVYEQAARPEPLLKVDVGLRNDGASIGPRGMVPIAVLANWDKGPGLGEEAGSSSFTILGAGQSVTLTLDLTRPSDGLDGPRELVVTANPYQIRLERDAANNQDAIVVGALAAPQDLQATVHRGSHKVFLSWHTPNDERIAGYIIERAPEGGAYDKVGATFGQSWLDLGDDLAEGWYSYRARAYSALGYQSPPSEPIRVEIASGEALYVPLVLRNRDER